MSGSGARRRARRHPLLVAAAAGLLACAVLGAGFYAYAGSYGFNVLLRRGGTTWETVTAGSPGLSPAMRLALQRPVPAAEPGPVAWRELAPGFDAAELPVLVAGTEVDRILLARVDPARFRFAVRNAAAGNKGLDDWVAEPGTVLVVNGSYYARDGTPDTPLLSAGRQLGPAEYDAQHGAFVATEAGAGLRDLATESWQAAFAGARDAMVSYPLLLAADGASRARADARWLANRSFVGQDRAGRIILGTTTDAFFSLDRLGPFLRDAPLDLATALNLDGGPVACQGIALGGYRRHFCGRWETQTSGDDVRLLGWRFGSWALPIVLAVVPR
ncbi:phosphodiester glycosidase family protein [Roseomonas sp. BN140053]|uniref:phosphodiester glycosidase family protein n=1 Tax=Roseomonas sp. BN140053 TaxID=3391898 RepID=UPI0039ED3404